MPLTTVVIPCFNDAERLVDALASVQRQTTGDWEAIVVDDASTQGDILATVRDIADPRIRMVRHQQNRGLAAARNTAIRGSTGALILPLDSDDRLEPAFLERLTAVLAKDASVDVVFPDFRLFGDVGGVQTFRVLAPRTLLVRQWLPGPGCLYRRTFWERVGGYCEDPILRAGNEDWEFWVAAAEIGFHAAHVAEPLYAYRVRAGSMSDRLQYNNHWTRELIHARHRALYSREGLQKPFLAEGYRASAQASLVRGERRRAIGLALHSLRLQPISRSTMAILLRAVTPDRVAAVRRSRMA